MRDEERAKEGAIILYFHYTYNTSSGSLFNVYSIGEKKKKVNFTQCNLEAI